MTAPVSRFRSFHGRSPRRIVPGHLNVPKNLIYLGEAVSIVYRCDKLNGGGDGKMAEYEHEFETPVHLYMDESGKRQLYLIGERLKVTTRGIEN